MHAVFGGTFDPFHLGHVSVAENLLRAYDFETFSFVPNQQNPLKSNHPTVSASLRLKMCQRGVEEANEPRLNVLDAEVKRQGPSYMYDTIVNLKKSTQSPLVLVLGNEVFSELPDWYEVHQLLNLCSCIILSRDPTLQINVEETLQKIGFDSPKKQTVSDRVIYGDKGQWVDTFIFSPLKISSTQLRQTIQRKWERDVIEEPPIGVQRSVWEVIKENKLYAVNIDG